MNTEQFLISRGYLRLDTSAPTVSVMYRISGSIVYCLLILNTSLDEFSVPQYTHIREQVVNSFGSRGYSDIRLHTLIVTSRQNSGREIAAMDGGAWILDGTSGRVILYENTVSDFDGIREGLEAAWTKDFAASVARAYSSTMERNVRDSGQAGFFAKRWTGLSYVGAFVRHFIRRRKPTHPPGDPDRFVLNGCVVHFG